MTVEAPTTNDRAYAIAYLEPLARLLCGNLDGLRITCDDPYDGRPSLILHVPQIGPVRVFVGREWFWWGKPHRMAAPLDDLPRAAKEIVRTLRRAQRRQAMVATRGHDDRPAAW